MRNAPRKSRLAHVDIDPIEHWKKDDTYQPAEACPDKEKSAFFGILHADAPETIQVIVSNDGAEGCVVVDGLQVLKRR